MPDEKLPHNPSDIPDSDFADSLRILEESAGHPAPSDLADTPEKRMFLESVCTHGLLLDPLTGVPNRRYYNKKIERAIERAQRVQAITTVAFVDILNLKKVNDDISHPAGDAAVKHVARIIHDMLRLTDDMARVGGDEFAVILWDTGEVAAKEFLRRLRKKIQDTPLEYEGHTIPLDVAYGYHQVRAGNAVKPADTVDSVNTFISQGMLGHKQTIKEVEGKGR